MRGRSRQPSKAAVAELVLVRVEHRQSGTAS
jgi:hypothetical protein